VLHKEPDVNDQGQQVMDADGKLRYRCGFRIGGGIDQDPAVSPQRYPDKAVSHFLKLICIINVQGGPKNRTCFSVDNSGTAIGSCVSHEH